MSCTRNTEAFKWCKKLGSVSIQEVMSSNIGEDFVTLSNEVFLQGIVTTLNIVK